MNEPSPTATTNPPSTSRNWLFRLLAICCGLSVFVLIELVCWGFGLGETKLEQDPFVGFNSNQPLLVLNEQAQRYQIAKTRLKFFAPDSFSAHKSANTKRIFCLGGSTVQGRPFSTETSYPTWLQLALNANDADHTWKIVNCGGISYASYRLVPIMQECLNYQPDLFIVCTGHNEFLEDRSYSHLRERAPYAGPLHSALSHWCSYRLVRHALLGRSKNNAQPAVQLTAEVDAILDYNDSLKAYHRDDQWKHDVTRHYESNLKRMVEVARQHNVPLIFVLPPSNLADSPPFKTEHRVDINATDQQTFQDLLTRNESAAESIIETVTRLEAAKAIDPQFAAVRYQLGNLYLRQDRLEEARTEFIAARDQDICPLRMISSLEQKMRRVADETTTPLFDAHHLLESNSRRGILDNGLLVDHVHPSFKGNQLIALALTGRLSRLGYVELSPDWQRKSQMAFQAHFDKLPAVYFAKGERTLKNLRAWSQGRADGPPAETRFPGRIPEQ